VGNSADIWELRQEPSDIQSAGDFVAALRGVAQQIGLAHNGVWPTVSMGDEYYLERQMLAAIVSRAESLGFITEWSPRLTHDPSRPAKYFEDFARLAEEKFGHIAATSTPATGWGRWVWAIDLAAEGIWQGEIAAAVERIGDANGKRKKRGRPVDTDQKKDTQIAQAWAAGTYPTHAALAAAFNMKPNDVKRALDRHRQRQKRGV
jgi:hypothetical protein